MTFYWSVYVEYSVSKMNNEDTSQLCQQDWGQQNMIPRNILCQHNQVMSRVVTCNQYCRRSIGFTIGFHNHGESP